MGNFFRCVRARANLRALMTQKSCAVGMRNEILRNHLNIQIITPLLHSSQNGVYLIKRAGKTPVLELPINASSDKRSELRFCSNNYSATVGVAGIPMLRDLAWPSLESRRTIAGLS